MQNKVQKTLILLKPDALERGLVGEVLSRLERKGLVLVAMKMLRMSKELARKHYAEHSEKSFYPALEEYITRGPVIAAVFSGPEAIAVLRLLCGPTDGTAAAPGTIRGDYSLSRRYNLIHASDSESTAEIEIHNFFTAAEIHE